MFDKLIKTRQGKIMLSILWGLGLSCLFRKVCKDRNCIIYRAPDPDKIMSDIYIVDNKCYKYNTKITKCTRDSIK